MTQPDNQPELRSLGFIDPDQLNTVRQTVPLITREYKFTDREHRNQCYLSMFADGSIVDDRTGKDLPSELAEPFHTLVPWVGCVVPEEIGISIDINPVEPGKRQRLSWHRDGAKTAITVSDTLPSLFVLGQLPRIAAMRDRRRRRVLAVLEESLAGQDDFRQERHDIAVDELGVKIVSFSAFEVVRFASAEILHASQPNFGNETKPRTWLRLSWDD